MAKTPGRFSVPETITQADRTGHLKIIATALVAATAFVVIAFNVRLGDVGTDEKVVVKAGQAPVYADKSSSAVR
jgi:hypothetical protein